MQIESEAINFEVLFISPLHLNFARTPRGRKLKEIWDTEFPILLRNREEFKKTYISGLNITTSSTPTLDRFFKYMDQEYPEALNPPSSE